MEYKYSISVQLPNIGTLEFEADDIDAFMKGFEGIADLRKKAIDLFTGQESSQVPIGVQEQYPNIGKVESYPDAVTKLLLHPEWGKEPRSLNELHNALAYNAIHIEKMTLGSMLTKLVRSSRLSRVKKDGHYAYMIPLQQRQ
jgi:hypothetical protein